TQDWGLLGYWVGEQVQESIPVFTGITGSPGLARLKHFGAAAASSGGVEMYHVVGITPEAPSLEAALDGRKPKAKLHYGEAERRKAYELVNVTASDSKV